MKFDIMNSKDKKVMLRKAIQKLPKIEIKTVREKNCSMMKVAQERIQKSLERQSLYKGQ